MSLSEPNASAMVLEDTAGLPISEIAKMRWLTSDEIVSILVPPPHNEGSHEHHHEQEQPHPRTGIDFLKSAPSSAPSSGSLFLCYLGKDQDNFDIGDDGHAWIRKTNEVDDLEILEDRVRLRHAGRDRISACYVHSDKTSTFHRRAYRLIDSVDEKVKSDELVLVHYLDTYKAYKVSALFADHVAAAAAKAAVQKKRSESDVDQMGLDPPKKDASSAPPQSYDDGTMDILWNMVYDDNEGDAEVKVAADIAIQRHLDDALEAKLSNAVEESVMELAGEIDDDMAFADDEDLRVAVERAMMTGEESEQEPPSEKVQGALVSALEDIMTPELETKIASTMKDVLEEGAEIQASLDANEEISMASNPSTTGSLPQTPLPEIVDFTPSEHCMDFENNKTKVVISTSSAVPFLPPDDPPYRWILAAAFIEIQATNTGKPVFQRVAMSPVKRLSPFSFKVICPQDIVALGERAIILLGIRVPEESDDLTSCKSTAYRVAAKVCIEAEWNVAFDLQQVKNSLLTSAGVEIPRPKFYAPAGGGNIQILTQFSEDLFKVYKSGGVSLPPNFSTTPLPNYDMEVVGAEGRSNAERSQEELIAALPAPPATMAVVSSAMLGTMNPPEVALGAEVELTGRKRARVHEEEVKAKAESELKNPVTPFCDANEVATDWVTKQTDDSAKTVGESVDRHCKIRFVERLANATVIANDDAEIAEVASSTPKNKETDELIVLNDDHFETMSDEELDLLFDNVLVRFVESLVESCTSEEQLKKELDSPGLSGFALLHYAALYGLNSLVPLLLSRGADPNITTLKGKLTPLHLACGAGHKQIVDVLVRSGARADERDAYGLWPADHALRNGFDIIAQFMYKTLGLVPNSLLSDENSDSESVGSSFDEENRLLVQSAFKDLSLKDKLGLNMFYMRQLKEKKRQRPKKNHADGMEEDNTYDGVGEYESLSGDASSAPGSEYSSKERFRFIDEKDKESLKVAMSLMSTEERDELEKNAPYSDVRKWMLKGNYLALREAKKQLDKQKKRDLISEKNKKLKDSSSSKSSSSMNNAKLSQALSMLVMRKNLLDSQKMSGKGKVVSRTSSNASGAL